MRVEYEYGKLNGNLITKGLEHQAKEFKSFSENSVYFLAMR